MATRVGALVVILGGVVVALLALGVGEASGSEVTSVDVSLSPTTAGVVATYSVSFTSTSALVPDVGTITLNANGGEAGTVFPSVAADYSIDDLTTPTGSGTVSATPTLSNAGSEVTVTVPAAVLPGDRLVLSISGVSSPSLASSDQTIAVNTSADTTPVNSSTYAVTPSPDGSGSMTVAPTSVTASTPSTYTFSYIAAAGGLSNGSISILVPAGWSAPSTSSGTAGYVTASSGTVLASGQTITVSGLTMPAGQTVTVVYGSGGGSNAAISTATVGSSAFSPSEQSTSAGTSTALSSSPAVQVTYAPDGSGALAVSPSSVPLGAVSTLSFTYTAAYGGLSNGTISIVVPSGWSAPTTTAGTAGYTTSSTGSVSVSGQTITVSGVTLVGGQTMTVTFGAGGGANSAISQTSVGSAVFTGAEQSTAGGTLTSLSQSPSVAVTYAPDGSGTMTASPASVLGTTPTTVTLVYTAAPGGTNNGDVIVTVPPGWTAPTVTSAAAGYTTTSAGTIEVSGQKITVTGLTLASGQTDTITYGAGAGAGSAGGETGQPGTATFATVEQSTANGSATPLSSSPSIQVNPAPDGSGTATITPAGASSYSPTTATITYTAAQGGMAQGAVTVTVPAGWTAPTTSSGTAGYTTASTGTVATSAQTITIDGVTLPSGGQLTVAYGAGGGSAAAEGPFTGPDAQFTVGEQSTPTGTLTPIVGRTAIQQTVGVYNSLLCQAAFAMIRSVTAVDGLSASARRAR